MKRAGWTWVALVLGCGAPAPAVAPPLPPHASPTCEAASELAASAAGLEQEGRLERLLTTARQVESLCPAALAPLAPAVERAKKELEAPADPEALIAEAVGLDGSGDSVRARRTFAHARRLLLARGAKVELVVRAPWRAEGAFFSRDGSRVVAGEHALELATGTLVPRDPKDDPAPPPAPVAARLPDGRVEARDGSGHVAAFPCEAGDDAFAVSPDGHWLALRLPRDAGGGVDLVDVKRLRRASTLRGTRCDRTTAMAFSPDSASLVIAGGALDMCLWDLAGPRAVTSFDLPLDRRPGEAPPPIRLLLYTPNGAGLVAGAASDVELYRMPSAERLSSLGPRSPPRALAGGSLFFEGGERPAVLVRPELHVQDLHVRRVDALDAEGSLAVADGALVETATGARRAELEGVTGGASAVFSADGGVVAVVARGVVRVFPSATGAVLFGVPAHAPLETASLDEGGLSVALKGAPTFRWPLPARGVSLHRGPGVATLHVRDQAVARVYALSRSSVVVTDEGTFDVQGDEREGERLLGCQVGPKVYPLRLCGESAREPGALAHALLAASLSAGRP